MKKFYLLAIIALSLSGTQNTFAQEQLDSLFYLNGKIETVSVLKDNNESIECTYPGENMLTTINKSKLLKIVFKSGRMEECNQPILKEEEAKLDKIYMANGDVIEGKIIKDSDESIEYTLPNETVSIVITKNTLNRIEFASGRTEEYGSLLNIKVITSKEQWKDVVVSYNESDLKGLEKVEEISKASGWGGQFASGLGYNDAIKKCKKEAANMGCGLIYIVDSPNRQNTQYGAGVRVNATAYRLPNSKK